MSPNLARTEHFRCWQICTPFAITNKLIFNSGTRVWTPVRCQTLMNGWWVEKSNCVGDRGLNQIMVQRFMTYLFAAKAGCRPGQSEAVYCQMTTTLGIGRKSHNPHVRLIGCKWQPSLFRTSISVFHKSNPSDRSFHVIQFNNRIPRKFPSTMKKQVVKRERIRQRPVEVAVDYLVSGDSDFVQREFAFLSKDM